MFAFSISGLLAFLNSTIFLVGYISNNALFPEPLGSDEERKYLELMKNGDEDARNILIEKNLRLVAHVCKKYTATRVDQDDLISIGSIGLIKGINSFDSSKGVRLATYVSRCIDNAHLTLRNYMTYSKQYLRHYKEKYRQIIQYNLQTLAELYQKQTSKQQQKTR